MSASFWYVAALACDFAALALIRVAQALHAGADALFRSAQRCERRGDHYRWPQMRTYQPLQSLLEDAPQSAGSGSLEDVA